MGNKKKYRYRYKNTNTEQRTDGNSGKQKTSLSVRFRVILLLVWGALAFGIYTALSAVSTIYSVWLFAGFLAAAFAGYFVISLRVAKYAREGKENCTECISLIDKGKLLLIFMIPTVFIILYDFIVTSVKIFM